MTIKITYHTVLSAADDVDQAARDLTGQLDALNGKVKAVVANWDGEAKAQFHAKHANWDENVKGLNHTLTQIANLLRGAAGDYQRTDKKAAAQFEF